MFDDILERKESFLNQTKRNGIKQIEKLGIFPKPLLHAFGQKIQKFAIFFLLAK